MFAHTNPWNNINIYLFTSLTSKLKNGNIYLFTYCNTNCNEEMLMNYEGICDFELSNI